MLWEQKLHIIALWCILFSESHSLVLAAVSMHWITGIFGELHDRQCVWSSFSGASPALNLKFCRFDLGLGSTNYLIPAFLDCSHLCTSCLELRHYAARFVLKVKMRKIKSVFVSELMEYSNTHHLTSSSSSHQLSQMDGASLQAQLHIWGNWRDSLSLKDLAEIIKLKSEWARGPPCLLAVKARPFHCVSLFHTPELAVAGFPLAT